MNYPGIILLTSIGLSSKKVYDKFFDLVSQKTLKKAVIITTASLDKEKNQYSQLALAQLRSAGLSDVDFYDFENDEHGDLSVYDVIYVCGGNTFKLMKFAREVNFDREIKSLLQRGGVYVGVSAGSVIVGPSISIANEVEPDPNDIGLEDLTGFNIINLIILPHYSPEIEEETKAFEIKYGVIVESLNNSQAILVENGEKTIIE